MHDAFDFAHHEDTLKSIKPQSEQSRTLTLMMFVVAATLSDRMQGTPNSVRHLYVLHWLL